MSGEAQGGSGSPRARNARGEGERLREALMDAATELLVERGSVDRLSIRGVTARAGVTPTAFYLHFADMEELTKAVVDRAFEELRGVLGAAQAAHGGDPRAQLRAIANAYVAFALERPAVYRVLFGTYIPGSKIMPPGGPDWQELTNEPGLGTFDDLTRAVARAGEAVNSERDPFEVAIRIWLALHGFVTLKAVMPSFPWPSAEDYVGELYDAYIAPAPPH